MPQYEQQLKKIAEPAQLACELAVVLLIQLQVTKMSADQRYQLTCSLRECLSELQEDL